MALTVYEVPDLHSLNLLNDFSAVKSAIQLANSILAKTAPLLSSVIMQMKIEFDNIQAPADLSIDKDIHLHINTEYWKDIQTNADLVALLTHEALHVTQNHVGRFPQGFIYNIAEDLAINQFDVLSKSIWIESNGVNMQTVLNKNFGQPIRSKLKTLAELQSADYYIDSLETYEAPDDALSSPDPSGDENEQPSEIYNQQVTEVSVSSENKVETPSDVDKHQQSASNNQKGLVSSLTTEEPNKLKSGSMSTTHDAWAKSSDESEQTIVNVVKQATEISNDPSQRGFVAGNIAEKIDRNGKYFVLPTLKQGIASFTKNQVRKKYENTFMRYAPPRSENVLRRGKRRKQDTVINIDVFVDASGSISSETLANVLASVEHINTQRQTPVNYRVHYFDTKVYEESDTEYGYAYGRGGTTFQSIFNWLYDNNRLKNNQVLIITDGYGEDNIDDMGYSAHWLITHTNQSYLTKIPTGHVMTRINEY